MRYNVLGRGVLIIASVTVKAGVKPIDSGTTITVQKALKKGLYSVLMPVGSGVAPLRSVIMKYASEICRKMPDYCPEWDEVTGIEYCNQPIFKCPFCKEKAKENNERSRI